MADEKGGGLPVNIVLTDISKAFGEKQVLSHFSCTIPAGSSWAVMAPSGRGKTTLLRLILGLEKPDAGTISGVPREKAAVFQEDRLISHLSPEKNIAMVASKWGNPEIKELLTALGLADCLGIPVSRLSGGQSRRVSLARALAAEGALLALDEPFTGLDEQTRQQAAQVIRQYRRGRTLILITHNEMDLQLLEIGQRIAL